MTKKDQKSNYGMVVEGEWLHVLAVRINLHRDKLTTYVLDLPINEGQRYYNREPQAVICEFSQPDLPDIGHHVCLDGPRPKGELGEYDVRCWMPGTTCKACTAYWEKDSELFRIVCFERDSSSERPKTLIENESCHGEGFNFRSSSFTCTTTTEEV